MASNENIPVPPEGAGYGQHYSAGQTTPPDGGQGTYSSTYSGTHAASYETPGSTGYEAPPNSSYAAPDSAFQPDAAATYQAPAAQAAAPAPKQKKGGGGAAGFIGGIVGAVVAVALVACMWAYTPVFDSLKSSGGSAQSGTVTIEQAADEGATTAEAVAAKCLDSVVTIYVYTNSTSDWSQLFGGSGSSSQNSSTPNALGSGVIVKNEGSTYYILTNYHVVEDISKATVKVGTQEYSATPVGYDEKTDLAVIKIEASDLTVAEWGDSSTLKVGEWAGVIGSPHGYEQSLTVGIISALYRNDTISDSTGSRAYTGMIQTDAAINPGNSGGGLFDAEGKLIGINTYIASTSGSSASIGFAIPQSTAQRIAEQLISGEEVEHAFMGISMQGADNGVEIAAVYKDTAAAKAGLKTGDIITQIDGQKVTSVNDVSEAILAKQPGDSISVTYERDGQEESVDVELGSDSDITDEYAKGGEPDSSDDSASGYYGYNFEDLFGGTPFSFNFGGNSGNSGNGGNSGNSGSGNSGNSGSGSGNSSFWD